MANFLTAEDLSERWCGRVAVKTLANWRTRRPSPGPRYVKLGSRVLYPLEHVQNWEAVRGFGSTVDHQEDVSRRRETAQQKLADREAEEARLRREHQEQLDAIAERRKALAAEAATAEAALKTALKAIRPRRGRPPKGGYGDDDDVH